MQRLPLVPDRSILPCLVAAALALATPASADVYVNDFEGGANPGGWAFIRGGDVFEMSGGNPGGWLHQPTYDTFAPILDCVFGANTPFLGDYREENVSRISLDAQTLDVDFGTGDGFQLTLVLRNSHGTPFDFDDDDYVYFIGPNVPRVGEGWVHYDFDVPSQHTGTPPAGWKGGWSGDCETLRPGVTWEDVITNVERVEFWWIDPCLFAIFQQWNVGADNIAIEYGDPASVDLEPADRIADLRAVPNPTDGEVTIRFAVATETRAAVRIVAADGRVLRDLGAQDLGRGPQELRWDGRDARGEPVPAGVYFVRIGGAGWEESRPVTVLER